jgi:hypothetical protein
MNTQSIENIRKLKDMTEFVLANYSFTRDDDKRLVDGVCKIFHLNPIAKASAIERCRRKLQEPTTEHPAGKYPPLKEETVLKRRENIDAWRVAMGYPPK